MPPVPDEAGHMIKAFAQLGRAHSAGFGLGPLPYTEIAAGAPWADGAERDTIRDMSRAYLEGMKIGEDAFGIPPWDQSSSHPDD